MKKRINKNTEEKALFELKPLSEYEIVPSSCKLEDGWYTITHNGISVYDIEANRISTYEDIVKWVVQLSEKGWITGGMIHDFILCTCKNSNLSPYGIR